MRRCFVVVSLLLGACAASSAPERSPVPDPIAAPPAPRAAADTAPPQTEPATKEVAALRSCFVKGEGDRALLDALASTREAAKKGPIADRALVDALWNCFARFRPSEARISHERMREFATTVLAVRDGSYAPKALELISMPIRDPKDRNETLDEVQFRQGTAIDLLGELRHAPAVRPLVTVLYDDRKDGGLSHWASVALSKMSREAEPLLLAALSGTDAELAKIAKASAEHRWLGRVAHALAASGRAAGREAVIAALRTAPNDRARVSLASELVRFPRTALSEKAFLEAYAKIPPAALIDDASHARTTLVAVTPGFFDPALTEWILRERAALKGPGGQSLSGFALNAAMKLMTQASAKNVGAVVSKLGEFEKTQYKAYVATLDACKADARCYVKWLGKPIDPSFYGSMGHVKAAFMAGIYGDAATRAALVERVSPMEFLDVKLAIIDAIDHLAPDGDPALASALDRLVEKERAAGVFAGVEDMAELADRLRARAL